MALLAGCGSTATSSSSTTTAVAVGGTAGTRATVDAGAPGGSASDTTAGSDYQVVSAAEVNTGLTEVRAMAAGIKSALATSPSGAAASVRTMYARWFTFEGTVRQNDKNLYLQIEDGLGAIKAGTEQNRPEKVDKGLKDLEDGASAYEVKFP